MFAAGIRHGKGSVIFPNGDTYHGDFRNGMRDGSEVIKRSVKMTFEKQKVSPFKLLFSSFFKLLLL